MDEAALLQRIVARPHVVSGRPTVRGLRVTVDYIINQISLGTPRSEILADMPWLEDADIDACLLYARRVADRVSELLKEGLSLSEVGARLPDVDGDVLAACLTFASRHLVEPARAA